MLRRFRFSVLALAFVVGLAALALPAFAGDVYVHGYYKSNGTYVAPHYRSAPDGVYNNNWSVKPNVNPYTGKPGTLAPRPDGWSSGTTSPSLGTWGGSASGSLGGSLGSGTLGGSLGSGTLGGGSSNGLGTTSPYTLP